MNISKKIVLLGFVFAFSGIIHAQTMIHPKVGIIGVHPFSTPNRHLFENRIDSEAWFVTEPLLMVSIESLIKSDYFSWRIMPGFYSDAASKPGFFFNAALKFRLFQSWRNSLHVAVGGSIVGRQLWNTIPGYVYESGFKTNGTWEYRICPFAELEYAFFLHDKGDITCSVLYGHQHETFTFSLGYRIWLSTVIKHPAHCGTCPYEKADGKYKKYK
ncbi:MAG: hypothetical protein KBB11_04270 [Bacteroidales bacterium]|nr:hypothetical protein [Bacteroidales bacterium]HOY38707.1 hypothetical protein [Bacteroidales bacterium]HQP05282.1 hypothetical protein [Bacteroidales bacterium]